MILNILASYRYLSPVSDSGVRLRKMTRLEVKKGGSGAHGAGQLSNRTIQTQRILLQHSIFNLY